MNVVAALVAVGLLVACGSGAGSQDDNDEGVGSQDVVEKHRCTGSLRCEDLEGSLRDSACRGLNADLAGQSCDANCGFFSCDLSGSDAVASCRASAAIQSGLRTDDDCRKLSGSSTQAFCRGMLAGARGDDCSQLSGSSAIDACEVVRDRMGQATKDCLRGAAGK